MLGDKAKEVLDTVVGFMGKQAEQGLVDLEALQAENARLRIRIEEISRVVGKVSKAMILRLTREALETK